MLLYATVMTVSFVSVRGSRGSPGRNLDCPRSKTLTSTPSNLNILHWWRANNSQAYADVHPVWHDCIFT